MGKGSVFGQKILTAMKKSDVLKRRENGVELEVKKTCKMVRKNAYGCWT